MYCHSYCRYANKTIFSVRFFSFYVLDDDKFSFLYSRSKIRWEQKGQNTRGSRFCVNVCAFFFFCFCKFLIEVFHSWGKTTAIILDQTIIYSSVRLLSYSGDFHTIWNKKKEEKRTTYSNAKIICHMKHTQVPKLFEYNHEMSRFAETYLANCWNGCCVSNGNVSIVVRLSTIRSRSKNNS